MKSVKIASKSLQVEVDLLGAQLRVLADQAGNQLLWNGDPSVWAGRAPILFPVIGCLAGGHYYLGDREYPMPKHGFARYSTFTLEQSSDTRAVLALRSNTQISRIYPFPFVLRIEFELDGAALSVTAEIENCGSVDMPASFGFHPALRWPLPDGGDREDHLVTFEAPEPAPIRRIDETGLLLPKALPSPVGGHVLHPDDHMFEKDALIFDQVVSRRVVFGAPGQRRVAIEFADFPILGVWTKPGAGFLCIEPWHGLPDPIGFAGTIWDKPGILTIAPNSKTRLQMRLVVLYNNEQLSA